MLEETARVIVQPTAGDHMVTRAQQREHAGRVMKILETLPEHQQEAVFLRFQGGLSYKEISEITGWTRAI